MLPLAMIKNTKRESGLAYIAILMLLTVLSMLGLGFAAKVRTQSQVILNHRSGIQADYLAESAANHAMWKLLNDDASKCNRVSHNHDDAEEKDDGTVALEGDNPELGRRPYVGLRFLNVKISKGAVISKAYIEFVASDSDNQNTRLNIQCEDSDDASRFISNIGDISGRPMTASAVTWKDIPPWSAKAVYQTPDLASIIQEVIDRPGWTSGNALGFLFISTLLGGKRRFFAHDKSPASAPALYVLTKGEALDSDTVYTMHSLAGGRYGYKVKPQTDTTFATIATVGAIDDHVVNQSYVLHIKSDPLLTSCNAEYIEMHQQWSPVANSSWDVIDLSEGPFYVPGNAVAEVAILNKSNWNARKGGVRAVDSVLDRQFDLHEAEDGGVDVLIMHVQADSHSRIEYYAENIMDVEFVFLGYWICANYVETFEGINAIAPLNWENHSLSSYGLTADQVAEFVVVNPNEFQELEGGIRSDQSSLDRKMTLRDAESGGVETATMLVQSGGDDNATVELWKNAADIEFYVVGYWSKPPGTYIELNDILGSPVFDMNWEDKNLSGFNLPGKTVAQIAMINKHDFVDNYIGLREKGSILERAIDLHKAEGGGGDIATLHTNTDENSIVQWYHEDVSESHEYRLLGYWDCIDTFSTELVGHWKLDESSGQNASDSSAKGNDGTLIEMDSDTDWVSGKIDGSLAFDGLNDYVLVPYDSSLSLLHELTVAAWIYANPGGLDSYDLVLSKGITGNQQNYWFGTVNDEIVFGFYNEGSREFKSDENLQTETWYHIAATFCNAKNRVRIYLNGTEVKNWSTDHQPLINFEDLYIGRSQYGQYWNGKLDDIRIYNRVLNEDEISALYYMGN